MNYQRTLRKLLRFLNMIFLASCEKGNGKDDNIQFFNTRGSSRYSEGALTSMPDIQPSMMQIIKVPILPDNVILV
jgi:hypothetical protein